MKKILLSIVSLCVAFMMHAQVAYLIPVNNQNAAALTDTVNALPEVSFGGVAQNPERNAYNWFHTTYPTGQVLTLKDVLEGALLTEENTPAVKALWIYVDRLNLAIADYDALFTSEVYTALGNFVKAGGNLFTAGQAARVVAGIGRTAYWPDYKSDAVQTNIAATDVWFVTTDFCTGRDLKGHAAFATCVGKTEKDGIADAILPLTSNEAVYARTDNNNVWGDWNLYWKNYSGKEVSDSLNPVPGGCDPNRAKSLEESQNCQVLGGWGHTRGLDIAGFIEFFPNGDYKGTVMAMGLAAYQWSTQNTCANMQHLTKGVLDYLNTEVQKPVWNAGLPTTGVINSQFKVTATSNVSVSYQALTPEIANIGVGDGNVYCNYFGEAQFVALAGDGMAAPKVAVASDTLTITVNGGNQEVDYAYVLPYSMHVMANWDNEDGQRPDFESAAWFNNTYVANGTGCYIRPADLATINEQVHTLWVNSDHVGLDSAQLMADLGGAAFVSALKTFVNKGNNVFLSKQATRLVGDLGRSAYPSYAKDGYADDRGDWRVGNRFAGADYSTHSAFARTGANPVIMQRGRHTDNNNLFPKEGDDAAALAAFQTNNNCLVLGSWGNNETFECAGMVEFYPQAECNGTILAMGLAAYQWGNANLVVRVYGDKVDENGNPVKDDQGNTIQEVKEEKPMMATLTQDILYYLNIQEAPGFVWEVEPQDGKVGETQQLKVEQKESALRYESSDETVATVSQEGLLTLVGKGTVTISAVRYGDGYKLPKNVAETRVSKEIVVDTATAVSTVVENAKRVEGIYDLLGRRLNAITTNGIYIVNGEKVAIWIKD